MEQIPTIGDTLTALRGMALGNRTAREMADLAAGIMMKEIPGEQLTTLVQHWTDAMPQFGLRADLPLRENLRLYFEAAGDTLVATVLQSGVMGGGAMAGTAVTRPFARQEPAAPVPSTPPAGAPSAATAPAAAALTTGPERAPPLIQSSPADSRQPVSAVPPSTPGPSQEGEITPPAPEKSASPSLAEVAAPAATTPTAAQEGEITPPVAETAPTAAPVTTAQRAQAAIDQAQAAPAKPTVKEQFIELGDSLYELYPHMKNLYLYREAESWIKSNLGAFMDEIERTPEEHRQLEIETRGWMKLLTPSIARYDADQHLSLTGLTSLIWLGSMTRYTEFNQAGIDMLAIPYSNWKLDPRRTALSMLDYCNCHPDDMTTIEETLTKDSQAGSAISQDSVKKKTTKSQFFDPAELNLHLQSHPYIHTADYEAPNTLKL